MASLDKRSKDYLITAAKQMIYANRPKTVDLVNMLHLKPQKKVSCSLRPNLV